MIRDITAKDARVLQREGVSQEERLVNAVSRCESAVIDTARNTKKDAVEVLVKGLNLKSMNNLAKDFHGRKFDVEILKHDEERSLVKISWRREKPLPLKEIEESGSG